MPKVRLDPFIVTTATSEGRKKVDLWDTHTSGLVLEIRASGGRTYYLRYQDQHGEQRQLKIARGEDISLTDARKTAKRLRSQVVLGGDPHADKQQRKAVPTYAEFADRYLAHVKTYQRSYATTEQYMRVHIRARWGKVRLSAINQADVAEWLGEKGTTLAPATVEKMRVILSHSLALAIRWGVPGLTVNPVAGIPRKPLNNAVERYLTAEQAAKLQVAVERSTNTQLRYIVGLLLLTGAREAELLNAQWSHLDLDRRMWRIPTSKTGKARHVPLSQAAMGLINELPRFEGCPYLVPNPKTKQPFVQVFKAWDTARKRAGIPALRIHDLRHSAASFMANQGIDLFAIGSVLGHSSHRSTMRYSHLSPSTLLAAVEAGAAGLKSDWAQERNTAA